MDQNLSETNIFKRSAMNLKLWDEMVAKFGIGQKLGVDLPSEIKGILPDVEFYNKIYKGANTWKFSNIYSLAIGEGEVTVSPMKMANVAAILANRGYYITPHIIKGIGTPGAIHRQYSERKYVGIDKKHFDVVVEGMHRAASPGGTLGHAAIMADISICGKTGTSQNRVGKDHAIFICFAPRDNPKIAIAVFVENGGFGGSASGPVASLMIEQYLKGKVERQAYKEQVIATNYTKNVAAKSMATKTNTGELVTPNAEVKTKVISPKKTESK